LLHLNALIEVWLLPARAAAPPSARWRPCGSAALGAMGLLIRRCIAARAQLPHSWPRLGT